jgi:hypothetical protein
MVPCLVERVTDKEPKIVVTAIKTVTYIMESWEHFSCHVNDVPQDASVALASRSSGVNFICVVVWAYFSVAQYDPLAAQCVFLGT